MFSEADKKAIRFRVHFYTYMEEHEVLPTHTELEGVV